MSLDPSIATLPSLANLVFLGDFPADAEAWLALHAAVDKQPPHAALGLVHRETGDLGGENIVRQWLKQGFQLFVFATAEHDEFSSALGFWAHRLGVVLVGRQWLRGGYPAMEAWFRLMLDEPEAFYAQISQDRILDRDLFQGQRGGVFVEVGACDGVHFSNTLFFERFRGWNGLCIEPHPLEYAKLEKSGRRAVCENLAVYDSAGEVEFLAIEGYGTALSGIAQGYDPRHVQRIERETSAHADSSKRIVKVRTETLGSLLERNGVDWVDLCSIDVEGVEMAVLRSVDYDKVYIRAFLVENNYGIEREEAFLADKGYRLWGKIQWDNVYVRDRPSAQWLARHGTDRNPKRPVKIAFAKFWKSFDPEDNGIVRPLRRFYDVEISDTPELVFYSDFSGEMPPGDYVKVFFTGECTRPPWGECDWAFTYDYDDHLRHYRLPSYVCHCDAGELVKTPEKIAEWTRAKPRFCNFVYSHPVPFREAFFQHLSQFKTIDSPGKRMNNMPPIGGHGDPLQSRNARDWRQAKLDFLKSYRFTIAFENESYPGYTTEKIVQAMQAGSIPIYWGNPLVDREFNPRSFINWHDYETAVRAWLPAFVRRWPALQAWLERRYVWPRTLAKVIQRVRDIESDPELYARILAEPWFHDNRRSPVFDDPRLETRLCEIVDECLAGNRPRREPVVTSKMPPPSLAALPPEFLYAIGATSWRCQALRRHIMALRRHIMALRRHIMALRRHIMALRRHIMPTLRRHKARIHRWLIASTNGAMAAGRATLPKPLRHFLWTRCVERLHNRLHGKT